MYRAGALVDGPNSPNKCKICVLNMVNSQSSMNSHKCKSEDSVVSGTALIKLTIEVTIDLLKSKPPSSRKKLERNPTNTRCFDGYVKHVCCKDRTTVTLYSSAISDKKDEICLRRRSTALSEEVLRSVVIARVATERLASPIKPSRSSLHLDTKRGCVLARAAKTLMEEYRAAGLGLLRNSCKTEMAGDISSGCVMGRLQMARAASYTTISVLCRRLDSKNVYPARATAEDDS
mmetsp:Transcript_27136/g.38170  ORF Transcript_27136/g.38170 Transcript_27136/m.38170 type:complete len:233 (-) Transcript_27136:399-1097(-)